MRAHELLAPLLAAGVAFAPLPMTAGCAGEAYLVDTAPPAPRAEVITYRPGYVWVNGHWNRRGGHWHWRDGYYVRERPDMVYIQPRWERRTRGWVYIDGGWRARGRVVIR
jgi:hypothetical protein